jgi:hypothetical protein
METYFLVGIVGGVETDGTLWGTAGAVSIFKRVAARTMESKYCMPTTKQRIARTYSRNTQIILLSGRKKSMSYDENFDWLMEKNKFFYSLDWT